MADHWTIRHSDRAADMVMGPRCQVVFDVSVQCEGVWLGVGRFDSMQAAAPAMADAATRRDALWVRVVEARHFPDYHITDEILRSVRPAGAFTGMASARHWPAHRPGDDERSSVCRTPADLYSDAARAEIGRAIHSTIGAPSCTPIEYLHSTSLAEAIVNDASLLRAATHRMARGQVAGTAVPAARRARSLQRLITVAHERLAACDVERPCGTFPRAGISGLRGRLRGVGNNADLRFHLLRYLVRRVAGAESLVGKLRRLDSAIGRAPLTWAEMSAIDMYVADILTVRDSLECLVPYNGDAAGFVAAVLHLFGLDDAHDSMDRTPAVERDERVAVDTFDHGDSSRGDAGPGRASRQFAWPVQRLQPLKAIGVLLVSGFLPRTRIMLRTRLIEVAENTGRFAPPDRSVREQLVVTERLRRMLVAERERLGFGCTLDAAFARRTAVILSQDAVRAALETRSTSLDQAQYLLDLTEITREPLAVRRLTEQLLSLICPNRFLREMAWHPDPRWRLMASVNEIHRRLIRLPLDTDMMAMVRAEMERVLAILLSRSSTGRNEATSDDVRPPIRHHGIVIEDAPA